MQTRMEEILAKDSDAFFKGRKKEFAYRPLLSTRYECPENIFVLCKLDSSLSKNREGGRESLNQNKLRKVEEGGETRVENASRAYFDSRIALILFLSRDRSPGSPPIDSIIEFQFEKLPPNFPSPPILKNRRVALRFNQLVLFQPVAGKVRRTRAAVKITHRYRGPSRRGTEYLLSFLSLRRVYYLEMIEKRIVNLVIYQDGRPMTRWK